MESNVTFFTDTKHPKELANNAISLVINGKIDPLQAYISMRRIESAIEIFKNDTQVMDITMRELSKYGKKQSFGDCVLEESESGVKYDYSTCGDDTLLDLYDNMAKLKEKIKDREKMLKSLPSSGMADPETGALLLPPAKSSKTIIKTTFKNK